MAEIPSYTSLYRRFRPQKFSEVLGQEHVTEALRNAVAQDRVSHAYLFSGPRGTGKTSTARILAKALNCDALSEGEPCGNCESCVSIAEGRSFDVTELDAASNSGVDAIRTLVAQAPTGTFGRSKVYIIDEVHMLSTGASNALLKTLEEPPSHVTFVLATTDPQKVLTTIKSRTQHFEFRLLNEETLARLIGSVRERAELDIDGDAVSWLLQKGGGSARDTLSYLDQVVALGYVPESSGEFTAIVEALARSDIKDIFAAIDAMVRTGQLPQKVCIDLVASFRSDLLSKLTSKVGSQAAAGPFTPDWLIRALAILGEALESMRSSLDPRIIFELALARIAGVEADPRLAALSRKVDALEREVRSLREGRQAAAPEVLKSSAKVGGGGEPAARMTSKGATAGATAGDPARRPDAMSQLRSSIADARGMLNKDRGAVETPPAADGISGGSAEAVPDAVLPEGRESPETSSVPLPQGRDEANALFRSAILPTLSPRARSLYSAARVFRVEGSAVVLSVPNEAHRSHAEASLDDVRSAFVEHFKDGGIQVDLIAHEGSEESARNSRPPEAHRELLEEFTVAPEAAVHGVESQLFEIFPGAKKVDP